MKAKFLVLLCFFSSVYLAAQDNCFCTANKNDPAAQAKITFNYKNGKKIKACGEYELNRELKAVLWSYIYLVECDSSRYFDFTPHSDENLLRLLKEDANQYQLKPTRKQKPLIVFTNDTAYLKMMMPIAAFDEDSSQHYDSYSLDYVFYNNNDAFRITKINPKLRKMDAALFEKAKKAYGLAGKSREEQAYFQELFFHAMVSGFPEAETIFLSLNKALLEAALNNASAPDAMVDEVLYFRKLHSIYKIGA